MPPKAAPRKATPANSCGRLRHRDRPELLLPADYVAQPGERIALYKELDKIERDSELKEFEERLRDRFGRIPRPPASCCACRVCDAWHDAWA